MRLRPTCKTDSAMYSAGGNVRNVGGTLNPEIYSGLSIIQMRCAAPSPYPTLDSSYCRLSIVSDFSVLLTRCVYKNTNAYTAPQRYSQNRIGFPPSFSEPPLARFPTAIMTCMGGPSVTRICPVYLSYKSSTFSTDLRPTSQPYSTMYSMGKSIDNASHILKVVL